MFVEDENKNDSSALYQEIQEEKEERIVCLERSTLELFKSNKLPGEFLMLATVKLVKLPAKLFKLIPSTLRIATSCYFSALIEIN